MAGGFECHDTRNGVGIRHYERDYEAAWRGLVSGLRRAQLYGSSESVPSPPRRRTCRMEDPILDVTVDFLLLNSASYRYEIDTLEQYILLAPTVFLTRALHGIFGFLALLLIFPE